MNSLSKQDQPTKRVRGIQKVSIPGQNMVGVIVVKRSMGMIAWRVYRCAPRDGETPFGRSVEKFKNYYVTGGYTLDHETALKRMNDAVSELPENRVVFRDTRI